MGNHPSTRLYDFQRAEENHIVEFSELLKHQFFLKLVEELLEIGRWK